MDQALVNERGIGVEVHASFEFVHRIAAEQIQGQVDGRTAKPDVVLQKGEQPFVAPIEFRGQGDQNQVEIERRKSERLRQPRQTRFVRRVKGFDAGFWFARDSCVEQRCPRFVSQQARGLFGADVEASKGITRCL